MAEPLNIRKLIDRISSGDIRIPAFQRDFVWEDDQVAFLLDSIYKGFPIGTVIFWRTDERLASDKNLGAFKLPEPIKDYPVNYVLDGQQRLTSLFSTFQTELEPIDDKWANIYFDMSAEDTLQESLFLALSSEEVDPKRHFPVRTLFNTVEYRHTTRDLDDEMVERIDDLQSRFKEYLIPNEIFDSSDRNKVAIVFERINRAGTELNVFELLSAWSWSEDFDLVDKFNSLQEKIAEHGYVDLVDDKDLQLRICAGIITEETSPSKILDLQGEDIRNRFHEIENGIIGAIDFLKRELGVAQYKLLPFPGILVPLSCFFATAKSDGFHYTDKQRIVISKWFWRSLFSRRFSSDVNERQTYDITQMLKLRDDEEYDFKLPSDLIKIDFVKTGFTSGSANSRTLILLLSQKSPKSFINGGKIDINLVLKKGSKHEFHHIFPKGYLRKNTDIDGRQANSLANICFLQRHDNNKIKDKPPKEYNSLIPKSNREEYLSLALCPNEFHQMNYSDFLASRADMIEEEAKRLMQNGR